MEKNLKTNPKKNLFSIANDLSFGKKYIYEEGIYNHYITTIYFSLFRDTLFMANKGNSLQNTPDRLLHDFYYYSIPKRNRYTKWPKRDDDKNVRLVSQFYKYSFQKAKSVVELLTKEQLEKIKEELKQME